LDILDLLRAALLGIIEGLTEFLPVSSTAHLILLGRVLGLDDPSGAFKVAIQLGAILALITIYAQKIWSTIAELPTRQEARRFALSVFLAFLPAAVLGVLLGDWVSAMFLEGAASDAAARIIAYALIIGGGIMLAVERFRPQATEMEADKLPLWKSVTIGAFQALALIPGVSRSGATIVGAMLLRVDRRAGAEFSFFLAMPTMLGATVYKTWQDRADLDFSQVQSIGVGFIAAFIAALLVVKAFLAIVSRYGFAPFAYYRIALGLLILVLVGFVA
jgi:undecaprenyl-diphosphatase